MKFCEYCKKPIRGCAVKLVSSSLSGAIVDVWVCHVCVRDVSIMAELRRRNDVRLDLIDGDV